MNGNSNPNSSYSQMRRGSLSGPDFSFFKQQAGFQGGSTSTISAGDSLSNFIRMANDVGSGGTPNAALAGKGQVDFGSSKQPPPSVNPGG